MHIPSPHMCDKTLCLQLKFQSFFHLLVKSTDLRIRSKMRFSLQIVKCFNNSRLSVELKKPINYVLVMLANQTSYRKTD